jgi:hypothetical protein
MSVYVVEFATTVAVDDPFPLVLWDVLVTLVLDSWSVVLLLLAPGACAPLHPKYIHRRRRWQCSVDYWLVLSTSCRSL